MHVVISFKGFYDKKEKIDGYLGYHQFSSIYLREAIKNRSFRKKNLDLVSRKVSAIKLTVLS